MKDTIVIVLFLLVAFVACGPDKQPGQQSNDGQDLQEDSQLFDSIELAGDPQSITDKNFQISNDFSFELYRELAKQEDNFLFSPYSISAALAMMYAGADGETATEMEEVLGFWAQQDTFHAAFANLNSILVQERAAQLEVANCLWAAKGFRFEKAYLAIVKSFYEAGIQSVDFTKDVNRIRAEINKWVEEQTRERIKNLIPQGVISPKTRSVLVNAIYFKDKWQKEFEPQATYTETFFVENNPPGSVEMMTQTLHLPYFENALYQLVAMPYSDENLEMVIILPKAKDGLQSVEKILPDEQLPLNRLQTKEIELYIPQFKIESMFSLKESLKAIGMHRSFSDRADFSKMSSPLLKIDAIVHKTFIEVGEKGTEAAAATAVMTKETAAMEEETQTILFKADHPFLFFIYEQESQSILFIGRFVRP